MDFGLKKIKYKLSEKVAHDQVMSLLNHYGINVDDFVDVKAKDATVSTLNKIVGFVREGLVEIMVDGKGIAVKQHLLKPPGEVKVLDYVEVSGKHKNAMDGKGEDHNYAKVYALAGALTNLGENAVKTLIGKDLSVVECLGTIFLAV